MTDVEFDNLNALHLLWVVLAAVVLGARAVLLKRRALRIFASPHLLGRLTAPPGWGRPLLRLSLQVACLLALVAAILHPRWGQAEQRFTTRAVDLMVLLDVSRSMLARDLVPNRLERAKIAIRDDLLPRLAGDRIGLIAFAGKPRLLCPLTHDYGFFRLVLDDVTTRSSPRGGTLIGDAMRLAYDAFDEALDTRRIVLLITDGEDHESYPVEAARALWEDKGIPVIVVALGDPREGARIPVATERGTEYLTYKGQVVWSRADFDTLRRVAAVSDLNAFVGVGTRDFDLGEIYARIAEALDARQQEETARVRRPSRYHPFAVLALLALLTDSFLRDGPRRRGTVIDLEPQVREAAA